MLVRGLMLILASMERVTVEAQEALAVEVPLGAQVALAKVCM